VNKTKEFDQLISEVRACIRCPRMCNSARVLSYSAGNLYADVMFVGEAPGRLGADQTEIPFHGDAAGHNFEELLRFAGIDRGQVFITNAVLCNPKDDTGNNATPNADEIGNCSGFLARQIRLVDPKIVVALGATALKALAEVDRHRLNLKDHVRSAHPWFGRLLIPLYHPGQRAMVHRSRANQRSDYQFVAEQWRSVVGKARRPGPATRPDIVSVCKYLLTKKGQLSYFELHKLAYLAEYAHVQSTGRRLTSSYFIRQKDGPYCTDLHIDRLRKSDKSIQVVKGGGRLFLRLGTSGVPQLFDNPEEIRPELRQAIDDVLSRYCYANDAELKKAVYLTKPMRAILRREQHEQTSLYNAPIDFLST
jgi:uracil-DNA glycosylase family 4